MVCCEGKSVANDRNGFSRMFAVEENPCVCDKFMDRLFDGNADCSSNGTARGERNLFLHNRNVSSRDLLYLGLQRIITSLLLLSKKKLEFCKNLFCFYLYVRRNHIGSIYKSFANQISDKNYVREFVVFKLSFLSTKTNRRHKMKM